MKNSLSIKTFTLIVSCILIATASCKEDEIVSSTRVHGRIYNDKTEENAAGIKIEVKSVNKEFDIFGGSSMELFDYTDSSGQYDFILEINPERGYGLVISDTVQTCPRIIEVEFDIDETSKEQRFDFGYQPKDCD